MVIASPHGFHYEQSKASLESGRHVLVEKPMALRAAEAWDLVETANARGLVLSIPTGWHYVRMVAVAKEKMDQGAVGEVEYIVCHMGSALRALYMGQKWPYPMANIPDPEAFYSDPELAGGGQGYSQLSHSVALLFWLTGLRGSEVFAYMSGAGAPVEMYDAIVAKFDNGSIGTISAAGTQPSNKPKHEMDIRIYGSEGELSLDLFHEHLTIHRADGGSFELEVEPGEGDYACDGPPNRFIDLILGRSRENWSPGESPHAPSSCWRPPTGRRPADVRNAWSSTHPGVHPDRVETTIPDLEYCERGRRNGSQHACGIRPRKIRSNVQQGTTVRLRDCIRETVAKVQTGGIHSFAPFGVGISDLPRHRQRDRCSLQAESIDKPGHFHTEAPPLGNDQCFGYRCSGNHDPVVCRQGLCAGRLRFVQQDRHQGRCVDCDHFGRPFSS